MGQWHESGHQEAAGPRLRAIDATRGFAMLFVCLSHFGEAYLRPNEAWVSLRWVYRLTMVASPTFMIVSGMMLGLLWRTHREGFRDIQVKLIDKGLFLLTFGRLLIVVAHVPLAGGLLPALRWGFITDAIGVSVIVGSLLVTRVGTAGRAAMGTASYVLGWAMILFWHPHALGWNLLRAALAGELLPFDLMVYADVFPLLPWFGLYLLGTCLGERLADLGATDRGQAARYFLRLGWACCALGLTIHGVFAVLRRAGVFAGADLPWTHLVHTSQKLPPSPAYMLFYGGAGILLTGVLFLVERHAPLGPFLRLAGQVGQTSLFVFVLQYFVYFFFLVLAALPYTSAWPLLFLASLLLVIRVQQAWHGRGLNRLLTVLPLLPRQWIPASAKGLLAPPVRT